MPAEAQALYFHMILRADDDGVVETYPLLKMLGFAPDNFKVLLAKGFIKELNEDQVVVILDWLEHNSVRADRKVDSIYKPLILEKIPDLILLEAKPRSDVIDNTNRVGGPSTDGIGKDRLGKVRLSKVNNNNVLSVTNRKQKTENKHLEDYKTWIQTYNQIHKSRYGASQDSLGNFSYWRETYSLQDMCDALQNIQRHPWLSTIQHTPTLILRRKDTHGNPVDRIGELLTYRKKSLREQLEEAQ
jgi:hypothetical protein